MDVDNNDGRASEEEEEEEEADAANVAHRRTGGPSLNLAPLLAENESILDSTIRHTQAAINRAFARLDKGEIT